jgi:hypothetical protein
MKASLTMLGALAAAFYAASAEAKQQFHLVRWEDGRCEILAKPPFMASKEWNRIGTFRTREEAEKALDKNRRLRVCGTPVSALLVDPPEQRPDMGALKGQK